VHLARLLEVELLLEELIEHPHERGAFGTEEQLLLAVVRQKRQKRHVVRVDDHHRLAVLVAVLHIQHTHAVHQRPRDLQHQAQVRRVGLQRRHKLRHMQRPPLPFRIRQRALPRRKDALALARALHLQELQRARREREQPA